jgi:hypothetical protein
MAPSRLERLAPLSGVLFIALIVAAIIVFPDETPSVDDSLQKVVSFWRDHDSEAMVSGFLFALSAVPFLWFAGSLRGALRASEGGAGRLSAVSFAGAIVFAGAVAIGAGLQFAVADAAKDVRPVALQAMSAISSDFFFAFLVGAGTFMLANAVVILRHRALHVAFGWTALVIGIAALTPAGFFAFLATLLWVLVASIFLYVRPPVAPGAPTAPATSPGSPS